MWDLTFWAHIWCVSGFVLKIRCYRSRSSTAIFVESVAPRAPALLWHRLLETSGRQRWLHGNPSRHRTPIIVVHRPKWSSGKSTSSLQLPWGRPASRNTTRRRSPRRPRGHPGRPHSGSPVRPLPAVRAATGPQARPRGVWPSATMRRRTGHSRATATSLRPSAGT